MFDVIKGVVVHYSNDYEYEKSHQFNLWDT